MIRLRSDSHLIINFSALHTQQRVYIRSVFLLLFFPICVDGKWCEFCQSQKVLLNWFFRGENKCSYFFPSSACLLHQCGHSFSICRLLNKLQRPSKDKRYILTPPKLRSTQQCLCLVLQNISISSKHHQKWSNCSIMIVIQLRIVMMDYYEIQIIVTENL